MRMRRVRNRVQSALLAAGLAAASAGGVPAPASAAPGDSYLLVGGTGSSNIGVLRLVDGQLTNIGSTVGIDSGTLAIAVAPNGRFAYVAHTISGRRRASRSATTVYSLRSPALVWHRGGRSSAR